MSGNFQKFGMVMGASTETVAFMFAAKWGSDWLNEHYPKEFNWLAVTSLLALILIMHSWYLMFRSLIRSERRSSASAGEGKDRQDTQEP